MNDNQLIEIIELLYPFFLEKLKKEGFFKNCVKAKMATVCVDSKGNIKAQMPYDTVSFDFVNNTGKELKDGDTICIFYWIDLKNAVAVLKI